MRERLKKIKEAAQDGLKTVTTGVVGGIALAYVARESRKARRRNGELISDVRITLAVCAFHDLLTDYIEQKVQGHPVELHEYVILREDFKQRVVEIFRRSDMGLIEEFCRDHNIQSGRDRSEVN